MGTEAESGPVGAPQKGTQAGLFLAGTAYVVGGMIARFTTDIHLGDAAALVRSTQHLLDGSLALYAERGSFWAAPPGGLSTGYPPLYAFVLAPFVALSGMCGGSEEFTARLIGLPMLLFDVLAVGELIRLVRSLRPEAPGRRLFYVALWSLLGSGLLSASWTMGHPEGMIAYFLFLGLRTVEARPILGGIFLGLALLSKQTVLLPLIPVGLALLGQAAGREGKIGNGEARRGYRPPALAALVALVLTFMLVFLPFFLAHPGDAFYALVQAEQRRVIGGANLWHFVSYAAHRLLPPATYAEVRGAILQGANGLLLLLVLGLNLGAAWRQPVTLHSPRMYGLMAGSALLLLVLGKWVEVHYYALPLLLLLLWDTVRRPQEFPIWGATVLFLVRLGYALPSPGVHPLSSAVLFLTCAGAAGYLFQQSLTEGKGEAPGGKETE